MLTKRFLLALLLLWWWPPASVASRQDPPPPGDAPREEDAPRKEDPPRYRVFERSPEVLAREEYEALRAKILDRCELAADTPPDRAPWYFHYEMGLALLERGDPQRALDALLDAADRRQDPQRNARLYGMWFRNYLPYFQIARAHATLGNWECAADAFTVSSRLGEASSDDREYRELEEEIRKVVPLIEP